MSRFTVIAAEMWLKPPSLAFVKVPWNIFVPAGAAAFTPFPTSGTMTSGLGFFGSARSLPSDPEGSGAEAVSSSALVC